MARTLQDLRQELDRLQRRLHEEESSVSKEDLLAFTDLLRELLARVEHEQSARDRRLKTMGRDLGHLDSRLLELESSRFFRLLRWPGRFLLDWRGRLGQWLLHSPLHAVYLRLVQPQKPQEEYQLWVERETSSSPAEGWYEKQVREWRRRPRISIVLPVHNPRREWLEAAVESVRSQSYPEWELCACDDASDETWVAEYFHSLAAIEPKIRFTRSVENLGISGASNLAGELAGGDYIGFLDQDDMLAPHALHSVAEILQEGDVDLIYSDEDRLNEDNRRVEPIFRPDWSPDLLLSCMYIGHFLVVKRECIDRVGWLCSDFDGSQDYDLVLRITDAPATLRHIPHVLYHWRKHPGSTSSDHAAKPYTHTTGFRALSDAVSRRSWQVTVQDGPIANSYHVRWPVSGEQRVSLVICSRKPDLLERCLRGIEKRTSYSNREIVIVQHKTRKDEKMEKLLQRTVCVRVPYAGPFHFARMNNLGAREASGEILVFLNDDVVPLAPEWLTELVAHSHRPEVGVVGAKLLYPGGAIQHAGLAIGIMDGVGHPQRDTFGAGYWNWWQFTRNVSAVTGACLAVRRSVFEQLGGFDVAFPMNYNDADLCLRAREAGYEVIYEPAALLRHDECRTRKPGVAYHERHLWQERWATWLERGDPFYNPNLTDSREDASLRF